MPNKYLDSVTHIVLQAGHGQGDPGATYSGISENTENNQIIARIARILRFCGIETIVDPDLNLANAISYVNQNYSVGKYWCLEIHKDSAAGVDPNTLRNRVGVYYYGGDRDSQAIAEKMINVIKNNGADSKSWARPDTVARFGRLGWIRDTKPLSHLIECGFIQDDTSDASDEKYAKWIAQAICDALEKPFKYDLGQPPAPAQSEPWATINGFDSISNASYYKDSYYNNNWNRILGDIYDRDKEILYWKQQQAITNQRITDLQNQLQQAQEALNSKPVTSSALVGYLNNYDYSGLPFDITQAVTNNNLVFILDRLKGLNSNYTNLLSRDQILKNLATEIATKSQTLASGF
jgi:N-acetylmuramoyl-L-alanine amidase